MSLFGADQETARMRVGLMSLVAGVLLVVWAWGSWVYRTTVTALPVRDAGAGAAATQDPATPIAGLMRLLLIGGITLIVIIIGSFVLNRAARRYFKRRQSQTFASTHYNDVWSQASAYDGEGFGDSHNDEHS